MKTPEAGKIYYCHRKDGKELFAYINSFTDEDYDLYYIDTVSKTSFRRLTRAKHGISVDTMKSEIDRWVVLQGQQTDKEYRRAFIQIIFLHLNEK